MSVFLPLLSSFRLSSAAELTERLSCLLAHRRSEISLSIELLMDFRVIFGAELVCESFREPPQR